MNRGKITTSSSLHPPYRVLPSDLPNSGILFVDHQAHGRHGEVVAFLLRQGARNDRRDKFGRSPAEVAKIHGFPDIEATLRT